MSQFRNSRVATPQAWQAVRDQIGACRQQLRRTEHAERRLGHEGGHPEAEEDLSAECTWLEEQLRRAHLRLILLIEQLELMVFLNEYRIGFKRFAKKLGVTYRPEHDPEIHESEALDYISASLGLLSASLEPLKARHEINGLTQVREILSASDFVIARAGIDPKREKDVQDALYDYLRILHPGARREVPIAHVIKTFKADIGIDDLDLLIEVKFIDGPVELRSEGPGIFEDMFGYRGDSKWKHYFALVYCTGPHLRQEELEAQFELADCPVDWTPIAVWGEGGRPSPAEAAPKAKGSTKGAERVGKLAKA